MSLFSNLDSRLGITRGDLTILLFVTATALAGFIYTTFLDTRPPLVEQREMGQMVRRHDSIVALHRDARRAELERTTAAPDSAPAWTPLTSEDAGRDEVVEKVSAPSASIGRNDAPTGPININSASKDALMKLPGVGEKTAEAIIAMRTHIPFRKPEDILNVKGIGEKKFEKMKVYIVVK